MPEDKTDQNEQEKNNARSEAAKHKIRDEKGHFIKEPSEQNPVTKFFSEHTRHSKSQAIGSEAQARRDDLVDVRIGNPLKRITELLEDIKQQKAFNFTLKGSLGVMGVVLTLSLFGIFGSGQILCEKGTQVEIGTIRQLQIQEEESTDGIPVLSQFFDYFQPKQSHPKYVLIKNDESVIQLPYSRKINLSKYENYRVIATGNYNACSQTLTVTDASGVELL